jgi:RNA polymerase sigma-70 factor (ECF subfamily)
MDGTDEMLALVARARERDPDAWEALYRHCYTPLRAYAGRRLPAEQAEDAVSETMVRALQQIHHFTWQGAGVEAWLYGICRNVVYEAVRSAGRAIPRADVVDLADSGGEVREQPLDVVLRNEEAGELRSAFDRLNADEQEVLELRVVGQLDADAVGTVLGKRAGAVRMAQSRALSRLRLLMAEVTGHE